MTLSRFPKLHWMKMKKSEQSVPTESLCPVCLERIAAFRVVRGDGVFLEKRCPTHGAFHTLIWKGQPEIDAWRRPKIATQPAEIGHGVEKGCPFDCGLCPDHRQRSCTIILEVTHRCDLGCPVCYADATSAGEDPPADVVQGWYQRALQTGGRCNIQLSGGEPTLRDDLPDLIAMGRRLGFSFIQINTNGLRLALEPGYAEVLKAAGAVSVFLQFDGTDDTIYRALRGRALWFHKQAAVEACARAGLGVVLVPTLLPGWNTHAVGDILVTAIKWTPTVRGVHFQPISYFGRYPGPPSDAHRLTLPELMQTIESATGGMFRVDHFRPPGCEHSLCSFHARYILPEKGRPRPLHTAPVTCCEQTPIHAEEGAARAIDSVARQWAGAPAGTAPRPVEACSCKTTISSKKNRQLESLDDFLETARSRTLAISAMAFQDVWNLDLERVRQCCIHIMAPDDRLIPFCLYNLTAADGRPLYRS